jgi:hypothetical protein
MKGRRAVTAGLLAASAVLLVWALFVALPRRVGPEGGGVARSAGPAVPGRKIIANLFYVAPDGTTLAPTEREVAFGETTVEQARAIITAQLEPVEPPLVSAVPPGTKLRALFVTPAGEAYVDLTREFVDAHPGGSMNERLTIHTLVDALILNLPAITSVQLLADGREIDTLAGHVDLRRPLSRQLR